MMLIIILYSLFCAWDYYKAYYLFGHRLINIINLGKELLDNGLFLDIVENTNINKFDFEGVNSPKRGGLN